jgi:hypothetical protein
VKRSGSKKTARHEIFVLTPEEKRTIAFVLIMFLLGVTTAYYRTAHSIPPSKTAVNETATSAARPAQKRAEAKHRASPR